MHLAPHLLLDRVGGLQCIIIILFLKLKSMEKLSLLLPMQLNEMATSGNSSHSFWESVLVIL